MRVRLGVKRTPRIHPAGIAPYAHEYGAVEGPPVWVELNGRRADADDGILSVSHRSTPDGIGVVTIEYVCCGYETVDADDERDGDPD